MHTCFFHAISACVPKVRNYGDFRLCVIPVTITCTLQGTLCDTGIPHTFYGQNICSVLLNVSKTRKALQHLCRCEEDERQTSNICKGCPCCSLKMSFRGSKFECDFRMLLVKLWKREHQNHLSSSGELWKHSYLGIHRNETSRHSIYIWTLSS